MKKMGRQSEKESEKGVSDEVREEEREEVREKERERECVCGRLRETKTERERERKMREREIFFAYVLHELGEVLVELARSCLHVLRGLLQELGHLQARLELLVQLHLLRVSGRGVAVTCKGESARGAKSRVMVTGGAVDSRQVEGV